MFIDADITRTGYASRGSWLRDLPSFSVVLGNLEMDRFNATSEDAIQEVIDKYMLKDSDYVFGTNEGYKHTGENKLY